jgi:hypothetical protein
MSDELIGQAEGSTPPPSEGSSLEERANALDAALVGAPPADKAEKPATSGRLEKLMAKYGGDPEKFADGVYEAWNSSARLASQLDEVKAQLAQLKAPPPQEDAEKATLANVPELKMFEDKIQSAQAKMTQYESAKAALANEYTKVSNLYNNLIGQLEKADAIEQPLFQARLAQAEAQLGNLRSQYENLDLRISSTMELRDVFESQQRMVAQRALEDAERRRSGEESASQVASRAREEFYSTAQEVLKGFGITEDDRRAKALIEATRAEIYDQLSAGGPPQDIPALTQRILLENARAFGLRDAAFSRSAEQQRTSSFRPPVSVENPLEKLDAVRKNDPNFWRQRASRVVNGR